MITIIIAHKDYQKYLPAAIESCIKQTYNDIGICVIDDGSQDIQSTKEIIQRDLFVPGIEIKKYIAGNITFFRQGSNSFIYYKDSKGPSFARNRGIEFNWEQSEAFMILDSDDVMQNEKVEIFYNLMKLNMGDIGCVYGDTLIYNEETQNTKIEFREPYSKRKLNQECIVHSGSLISKKALAECNENGNFYDEEMRTCEDYDLWMRISEKFIIAHVPLPLTTVTIQPKNSSVSVDKSIWENNWQRVHLKANEREKTK